IYVAELRPENFNSATDSIKLIYSLCSTPKYKEASLEEKRIYRLNGAITKKKADLIPKDINAVILQDFTKVFLTYRDWQSLTKKYNLYFTEKFKLSAFIVNLYHINANNFKKALNSKEIMEKVIFNPYAE
ncbi:MAG: hypothetical protein U9Q34_05140, partial [Elusimicrobiota bacterium]|nr:hypothetical protein [Elusimicrobiota bacterium]